jgi:hypothetical protein
MGLFNKIFKREEVKQPDVVESKPVEPTKEKKPRVKKPRVKKPKVELTEKEKATQAGEPYVNILKMDVDPNDVNNGAFELDWNDKFVLNLIRAGYKFSEKDTDQEIVDRWFQTVCRNVALEMYEQTQADPMNRDVRPIRSRDIGNGRTEVS